MYQMCTGTHNNVYINAVGDAAGTIDNVKAYLYSGNPGGLINMSADDFEGEAI